MANFIKHTWVTGEQVTASLLNRIENGIAALYESTQEMATDADCDALFENFLKDDE